MATSQEIGKLDPGQDLPFQRREWMVQRVGWVVMGLVMVGAMFGLTGSGLLSRASAGDSDDPLQVRFARFGRLEARSTLHLRLDGAAVSSQEVELWIDNAYLETVQIEQISPEPDSVSVGPERTTYVITLEQPGQPVEVAFHLRHQAFGWHTGHVGLTDGPTLEFRQLIYP